MCFDHNRMLPQLASEAYSYLLLVDRENLVLSCRESTAPVTMVVHAMISRRLNWRFAQVRRAAPKKFISVEQSQV
jgi:hypothetical protein